MENDNEKIMLERKSDNEPSLRVSADQHGIHPDLIKPGKPTHTAYIKRFNRTYRNEVLACDWFNSLTEVRE